MAAPKDTNALAHVYQQQLIGQGIQVVSAKYSAEEKFVTIANSMSSPCGLIGVHEVHSESGHEPVPSATDCLAKQFHSDPQLSL